MQASDPNGLRNYIRDIPDFPKPGILFRDLTPLLADVGALRRTVQALAAPFKNRSLDYVIGTEARGFLFGAPVALELGNRAAAWACPNNLSSTSLSTLKLSFETTRSAYAADAN